MRLPLIVAALSLVSVAPTIANAGLVFDNGSFSLDVEQGGYFVDGRWIQENFAITETTTIDALVWSQHDQAGYIYEATHLTIYNLAGPDVLLEGDYAATRTANDNAPLPLYPDRWTEGFNYDISGLNLTLDPGVYSFRISNNTMNGTEGWTTWDQSAGTSQAIPGWTQSTQSGIPGTSNRTGFSAFQIYGQTVSVPEPSTIVLLGFGSVVLLKRRLDAKTHTQH